MKPLRITEEAIVYNLADPHRHLIGQRVTIVGELMTRDFEENGQLVSFEAYRVQFESGKLLAITPGGLMRPPPIRGDMDQKITWANCSWQPTKGKTDVY